MKLFPRSPSSTLEPSTTVILPTPPRTKFFKVSEPVGPQFNKHMLAFSRAACPFSPQILKKKKTKKKKKLTITIELEIEILNEFSGNEENHGIKGSKK